MYTIPTLAIDNQIIDTGTPLTLRFKVMVNARNESGPPTRPHSAASRKAQALERQYREKMIKAMQQ